MSVVYKESAGLAVGHKVVWISDGGPEVGVVKWIGVCRMRDKMTSQLVWNS